MSMGENPSLESFYQEEENGVASNTNNQNSNSNHGWQKVIYAKRQRKPNSNQLSTSDSLTQSDPSKSRSKVAPKKAAAVIETKSKLSSDEDALDDDGGEDLKRGGTQNGTEDEKVKQKKPKKPKVTVADAASKMDASDLAAFLVDVSTSYEGQQNIQLMRFADYFARAFSPVSAAQFPWTKLLKESSVVKIVDIPLCYVPEAVYKISVDWVGKRSNEAIGDFLIWSLDSIISSLTNQQKSVKVSKKSVQPASSKAQIAIFVVLAMVLRRKPDVLINQLPKLRDDPKYQGQDKLPVIVWVIAQACQGDLVVGMLSWVQNLLPIVCGKSSCNPQSRDVVLQLVEWILSAPKARPILLNGAVRKGERLVPPSALELLMRASFPAPSSRLKATERFEAVYPIAKELALSGSRGTRTMKQVSQQLLPIAVNAMSEGNSELSKEAAGIFIWCLSLNTDCFRQWEKLHLENIEASLAVLQKLSSEWKEQSIKLSLDTLKATILNLRLQNEQASAGAAGADAGQLVSIRNADKYCKAILGRLTHCFSCMTSGVFVVTVTIAVGAVLMSANNESWDWKKLHVLLTSPQTL